MSYYVSNLYPSAPVNIIDHVHHLMNESNNQRVYSINGEFGEITWQRDFIKVSITPFKHMHISLLLRKINKVVIILWVGVPNTFCLCI